MHTQIVKPATGRFEGAYLLSTFVAILAICGSLIFLRQTKLEVIPLQPYQISAFSDLSKTEQGLFNDLYAAALELQTIYRDSRTWLAVDDLVDLAMPPFTQTALSQKQGGHQWSALPFNTADTSTMAYLGKSARTADARSFLLVMTQRKQRDAQDFGFTIWVSADAAAPSKAIDPVALSYSGWREAVALKGEDAQRGATQGRAQ
jgi:hypothetical protein